MLSFLVPKLYLFNFVLPSEPEQKCSGVNSRPLDSEDLRLIEDDLSKQLGSSPKDREWENEPDLEPYVTSLENGGTKFRSSLVPLIKACDLNPVKF